MEEFFSSLPWEAIALGFASVLASVVSAFVPDKYLGIVGKALNALALNVGKAANDPALNQGDE